MRALYEAMRSRFLVGGRHDTSSASGATGAAWSAISRSGTTAAPRRRSARSRSSSSGSDSVVVCRPQCARRPSGAAAYTPYPFLPYQGQVGGLHVSTHWERPATRASSFASASSNVCRAGTGPGAALLRTSRCDRSAPCMFPPPIPDLGQALVVLAHA